MSYTSAPFFFCYAPVVRGDVPDVGRIVMLLVLLLPLIPTLLIVGRVVGLVLMCGYPMLLLVVPPICVISNLFRSTCVVAMVWSISRSILYEFLCFSIPCSFPYILS